VALLCDALRFEMNSMSRRVTDRGIVTSSSATLENVTPSLWKQLKKLAIDEGGK
jgi:predicted DNA-binding ribbon-helix-helix protein